MNKTEFEGVYFITEVAQAVKWNQLVIKSIKRIQYWKGGNEVFREFISAMYVEKVQATAWGKLLGKEESTITDDEKKKFVEDCCKLGILVKLEAIRSNPALCSVIKIIINSLWGGLSQRPNVRKRFSSIITTTKHGNVCLAFTANWSALRKD